MTHHLCPLNPKRRHTRLGASAGDDDAPPASRRRVQSEESSEDSGEASANPSDDNNPEPFPYPLGTWVAVEFGDAGVFSGTVTKLYPGEDLCEVTFSDGDKADYDADQICYATQLYKAEFE